MINITKKTDCSGCYACYSVCPVGCITMKLDSEGFWYPVADASACIQCGKCEQVCHILKPFEPARQPKAFAAYAKDNTILKTSSSGGVFTPLCKAVITDGGVVFGAAFDRDFNVCHIAVEEVEDLRAFRGSKYVQSKIDNALINTKSELEKGRLVLFSGTPCQIAGLKLFLKKEYENLITADVICHGVPSPKVWTAYKRMKESDQKDEVRAVRFRDKTKGWQNFSLAMDFSGKLRYRKALDDDPYLFGFFRNLYLRPSCYDCVEKSLNRKSDITLADYWGIEHIHPEFTQDKGVSLVFANTFKGIKLFDSIKPELIWMETDIVKSAAQNIAATKSAAINPKREMFFKDFEALTFKTVMKRYTKRSLDKKIKKHLSASINRMKRAVKWVIGYNR